MIGGAGPAKFQSPQTDAIKIINKTTTLERVGLTRKEPNHLILVLKNVSSKNLNGFAVALNDGMLIVDISSGDRFVSPAQTTDLEIPFTSPSLDIVILAAMFTDGSIEGDPATSTELKDRRLGLKKELIRAVSVLDEILASEDADAVTALDRLESKLSSLAPESDVTRPQLGSGAQDAKSTLSTEIQILRERRQRNGSAKQKQRLIDLRARIQRRIASL
jgi:hypothetical protein